MISNKRKEEFQKMIFSWWKTHRRDLPWRHTRDPYFIMVSEVMLQQTQVSRVTAKYLEFITRYPTIESLASTPLASVIRLWKGLGYNRRAVYLHNAAKAILVTHNGMFPKDERQLLHIPGLGKYTARAILVFAYEKQVSLVDTNIRQIITHFFFRDVVQNEKIIQSVADALLPKGKSWEWHQALMDYGALELHNNQIYKSANTRMKNTNINKIPFKKTDRFYRGRIIDVLREQTMKKESLVDFITMNYTAKKEKVIALIASLEKEGLLVEKRGILSLP